MQARKSLFGPVLLIALGIVFLAHNLVPELSLVPLFADYWPWILVFWGGFRLAEFAVARLLGRRAPEPLGAGAVIVAVFLCVAGSAAHSLARNQAGLLDWLAGRGAWFDVQFDYPLRHEAPITTGQGVLIRNLPGRIRIVASEQPGVRIEGHKRVRAANEPAAVTLDEQSPLEVSVQGERLVVQPKSLPDRDRRRVSFDVSIEMPASTPVHVEGARGFVEVFGIAGGVSLDGSGSIEITDVSGPVTIQARRIERITARRLASSLVVEGRARRIEVEELAGAVTIDGSVVERVRLAKVDGPSRLRFNNTGLEIEKLTGELEITERSIEIVDAVGPLRLNSRGSGRNRRIRLEGIAGTVAVDAERGDLVLLTGTQPLDGAEVRLGRGEIEVVLDPDAAFTIEASTARGTASHEFGAALQVATQDRRATLRGGRGQGPLLKLETGRGDIQVRRAEGPAGRSVEI